MSPDSTKVSIAAAALDGRAAYRLMTGAITPRPIAWTTTLNLDGSVNLAPFSSFVFLT
jgi:flavin reductase (DIM6/NTAB) family NADH-FMN oxidoreductase RutF